MLPPPPLLAVVLQDQRKYDEAESMNRRALTGREKALGLDHPDTLTSVHSLAYLLGAKQNFQQALDLYQRAVSGYNRVLGVHHPMTAACKEHLSSLSRKMGRSPLGSASILPQRTAGRILCARFAFLA